MSKIYLPRFTLADAERAAETWGANCGPGAVAAMMGLTLDELRPAMGDFERKGYTNPTLMIAVLKRIGAKFHVLTIDRTIIKLGWPIYGLARIQWEGPWTAPEAPPKWRYRQTHWIGSARGQNGDIGIFDINCMNNGTGWCSIDDWQAVIAPALIANYPRANGKWHITHAIEIDRASVRQSVPSPGTAAA